MSNLEPTPEPPVRPRRSKGRSTSRWAGILGRVLIGAGVLVLLFVLFQIFGTSYIQAKHQAQLRGQIDTKHRTETIPSSLPPSPPATVATMAAPGDGAPLAVIEIPKINLNQVVIQGTNEPQLELGPGHYNATPLPGEAGNASIAGHRTTWGHPFYNLDKLVKGDKIYLATSRGTFVYTVTTSEIVDPTDVAVLDPTFLPTLTLTTCNPKYSAAQRLVVKGALTSTVFSQVLKPETPSSTTTVPVGHKTAAPSSPSPWPAVGWGLLTALLCVAAWFASTKLRRSWVAYVVATPFVAVSLFLFFAAISSQLPAGL